MSLYARVAGGCVLLLLSNSVLCARYEPKGWLLSNVYNDNFVESVALAFEGRQWTVVEKTSTYVRGELEHREYKSVLKIYREGPNLMYFCEICTRTEYGNPQAQSPHLRNTSVSNVVPERWIANLRKDAKRFLSQTGVDVKSAFVTERRKLLAEDLLQRGLVSEAEFQVLVGE